MAEEIVYTKVNFSDPKPTRGAKTKTPKNAGHNFWNSPYISGLLLLTCISLLCVSVRLGMQVLARDSSCMLSLEANRSLENQQNLTQMLADANQRGECLRRVIMEEGNPCPWGWMLLNQKCYFLSNERKTREDGEKDCAENGAVLATVGPTDLMLRCYIQNLSRAFWIGLQRRTALNRPGDTNIRWVWADGTEGMFVPDAQPGHCAKLNQQLQLTSSSCNEQNHWICELRLKKSNILIRAKDC